MLCTCTCYVHVFVYCHLNSAYVSVYLSVMYVCMYVSCVCWLYGFFLTFDLSGILKRSVNLCIIFNNVLEIRWPWIHILGPRFLCAKTQTKQFWCIFLRNWVVAYLYLMFFNLYFLILAFSKLKLGNMDMVDWQN